MGVSTVPLPAGDLLRLDASGTLQARRYRLTVTSGPDTGLSAALEGLLMIGTAAEASLSLSDGTVSRLHAELEPRSDGVRVRDLGSTNGILINGVRVQEAVVEAAVLRLGRTELRLSFVDQEVGRPPARDAFGPVLGASPSMRALFGLLDRVAATSSTVLLTGETGTGKEIIAEAIHQASPRRARPFVVVDCAALPTQLAESELFGHVRGAFTGAVADRVGAFADADGGTVLLDEIGELPAELQPKLLRFLEAGTVKRLGENATRRVNVRVVGATHRALDTAVAEGRFRRDLYFRLAVVPVAIPALRDRRQDVPVLARNFFAALGGTDEAALDALLDAYARHDWPGNVRELRNVVERFCASGETTPPEPGPAGVPAQRPGEPFKQAKERAVERFTRDYLIPLHEACDGNVSEIARRAGLARNYVQQMLDRYGIRAARPDPDVSAKEPGSGPSRRR